MRRVITNLFLVFTVFSIFSVNAVENTTINKDTENAYIKILKEQRISSACTKKNKKSEHCIVLRVRCKLPVVISQVNMPLAVITWFDKDGIPQASSPSTGKCNYPGEVTKLKLPLPKKEKRYKINLLPVLIKDLNNIDFSRW